MSDDESRTIKIPVNIPAGYYSKDQIEKLFLESLMITMTDSTGTTRKISSGNIIEQVSIKENDKVIHKFKT